MASPRPLPAVCRGPGRGRRGGSGRRSGPGPRPGRPGRRRGRRAGRGRRRPRPAARPGRRRGRARCRAGCARCAGRRPGARGPARPRLGWCRCAAPTPARARAASSRTTSSRSIAVGLGRRGVRVGGRQDEQVADEPLHLRGDGQQVAGRAPPGRWTPGWASATSSCARCAASGLCRSCETSATKSRCRRADASSRASIRFIVAASGPTSSSTPVSGTRRSRCVLGDRRRPPARIRSTRRRAPPSTSQVPTAPAAATTTGTPSQQRPAQRRGGLVDGLQAGADVDRDRSVGAGAGAGPEPVGLGLGVVRGVDGADDEAGRRGRSRRSARRPGTFGEAARTRPSAVDDLGDALVVERWSAVAGRSPARGQRQEVLDPGPGQVVGAAC